MILVGNQRGGAKNLALHLMKEENEHVEVHEIRGFASDNLMAALNEAYAMSRATRCRQFLFSLSLNPPQGENVPTEVFEKTIERAEQRLGLSGQPRAIVFHEKQGRRHAHAVWSRIDAERMKAVQLSYTHNKLNALAKELYLEHGWKMPRGFIDKRERDPRNFTLAEWQQAKRIGKDARAIKADFQDSWASSDSKAAFAQALRSRGYWLARGDRRGYVALDMHGEAHSIAKRVGIKTRQVRERLGDIDQLPGIPEVRTQIANEMASTLRKMKETQDEAARRQREFFEKRRVALVEKQRGECKALDDRLEKRRTAETQARQARYTQGLKGLWDRLRGEHGRVRKQNEQESYDCLLRDRKEKNALIFQHIDARRRLETLRHQERQQSIETRKELKRDISAFEDMRAQRLEQFKQRRQELPRPARQDRSRDGPQR